MSGAGRRLPRASGWLYFDCGDVTRATDSNQRAAARARERGDAELIANSEINLADSLLAKGDLGAAFDLLAGVLRLVNDPTTSDWMKWRYSTHLFASLGELWFARGDLGRARRFADQSLEVATRTNARKYIVRAWRLVGEIAMARGQPDEAEESVRRALGIAQAIGNPTELWKTHFALGRLHAWRNRPEAARQAHQAARKTIDAVKARLENPGLRASFESAPSLREACRLGGATGR